MVRISIELTQEEYSVLRKYKREKGWREILFQGLGLNELFELRMRGRPPQNSVVFSNEKTRSRS
jgi:hypothetical protein